MRGIEISRAYFEEYGKPMLEEHFADILPFLCVGLVGSGSECYGFDDEISRDHDFEPGFCIFIPNENIVDRRTEFLLERAYAKLPKEFMELKRSLVSPVGGRRNGVIRISDFYKDKIGKEDGNLDIYDWLSVSDSFLFEATDGEIFFDNYGEFTKIRKKISRMPQDIRLKKLAGNLLLMAQSGQYNYSRCLSHGETGAAQLAVNEFVQAGMRTVFLLNEKYMPYYKWSFRAMRNLELFPTFSDSFEYLLTSENDSETAEVKIGVIEDIAGMIIGYLIENNMTKAICGDLEKHAYSVNDSISDPNIRNMNIFSAV